MTGGKKQCYSIATRAGFNMLVYVDTKIATSISKAAMLSELSEMRSNPTKTFQRLLVIKHGALGDIIQGFDAFASLRKGFPTAHIAVLTTRPYEKLMLSSNWFDEVIIDQRASVWNLLQAMRIRTIFKQNWDKVIDLQCSERTATYAKLKLTSTRWFGTAPNATDLMTDFAGITNRKRMLAAVSMAGASKSEPDLSFLTSFPEIGE